MRRGTSSFASQRAGHAVSGGFVAGWCLLTQFWTSRQARICASPHKTGDHAHGWVGSAG